MGESIKRIFEELRKFISEPFEIYTMVSQFDNIVESSEIPNDGTTIGSETLFRAFSRE